jgi:hypothetical protein
MFLGLSGLGDSANIRRSQRQQDRIERQEAERILAENQQMLQREKEIMKGKEVNAQAAASPPGKVVSATVSPPASVGVAKTPSHALSTSRESIDSSSSDK